MLTILLVGLFIILGVVSFVHYTDEYGYDSGEATILAFLTTSCICGVLGLAIYGILTVSVDDRDFIMVDQMMYEHMIPSDVISYTGVKTRENGIPVDRQFFVLEDAAKMTTLQNAKIVLIDPESDMKAHLLVDNTFINRAFGGPLFFGVTHKKYTIYIHEENLKLVNAGEVK